MATVNTVAFLVENKPGVLFNVSNLFRRRGYNIQGISVGPIMNSGLSRMTISVEAEGRELNQIVEQLDKMVDVVKVKRLDPVRTVQREMALVKIRAGDPMAREEALRYINNYHGHILDIEPDTIIAEVTGEADDIDQFLENIRPIGIEEMSRTGVTALEKGRLRLQS
jgi:acetolactate synthase-1/3 small subunit